MNTQLLVETACRKLGLPEDVNVVEIASKPRAGSYRSKIKGKGMTLVLTQDQNLVDQMVKDGWGHRGYEPGNVLFKEV